MDNRRTLSIIAQGAGNTRRSSRTALQNTNNPTDEDEEFTLDEPAGLPEEFLQRRRSSRVCVTLPSLSFSCT